MLNKNFICMFFGWHQIIMLLRLLGIVLGHHSEDPTIIMIP